MYAYISMGIYYYIYKEWKMINNINDIIYSLWVPNKFMKYSEIYETLILWKFFIQG